MTYLTQAIVLKKCAVGDYDCQYTLYTHLFGKVNAIAKGAKRVTSKMSSHLEPFLICQIMLAQGQVFKRLAAAQITQNFSTIKSDLTKIFLANYFLEIADNLIVFEAEDRAVFEIIENFFQQLALARSQEPIIITNKSVFELLKQLGYQPKITAQTQKQLFFDLLELTKIISEKEVKNEFWLRQIFN